MLLFKRLITLIVVFAILFPMIDITMIVVGGAIAGGIAGAKNARPAGQQTASADGQDQQSGTDSQSGSLGSSFQKGFQRGEAVGKMAGARFRLEYGRYILLGSVVLALVFSYQLSFGGGFVWCRVSRPPPIPRA